VITWSECICVIDEKKLILEYLKPLLEKHINFPLRIFYFFGEIKIRDSEDFLIFQLSDDSDDFYKVGFCISFFIKKIFE
jgi:hypothetical protein